MTNTLPFFRRKQVTPPCHANRALLRVQKFTPPPASEPVEACEKQCMSEKEFLRSHSLYSAMSSWLFAIAGATNIGVLCALSSKILMAVEKGQPIFKSADPSVTPVMSNKKYNRITLMMIAFGGVCMAFSNWLESKKVVTEWQLGAGKLQRKYNIAEKKAAKEDKQMALADAILVPAPVADTTQALPQSRNWAASMHPLGDDFADRKTPKHLPSRQLGW